MKGFRDFVMRGNLVELAVAFIMGAAFATVVTAFTKIIIELLAKAGGAPKFDDWQPGGLTTVGPFLTALVAFLLLAFIVYFFIVKPVLHTTEKTVESTNHSIEKSFESSNFDTKGIEEKVNKTIEEVNNQVQVQVEHSFHTAKTQGGEAKTEKLLHCIQRAHENVHRIERCSRKFS